MTYPSELRYTTEHEWVRLADGGDGAPAEVGITAYAAEALGDVVYVQLPEVGATVTAGETCGELESTKSVSDLYAPVTGEVVEVNGDLDGEPSLVNEDPYGKGWLFKVAVSTAPALLSADDYAAHVSA